MFSPPKAGSKITAVRRKLRAGAKLGARVVVFASMLVCSLTRVAQANAVAVGVDTPAVGRLSADDQAKLLNSLHES